MRKQFISTKTCSGTSSHSFRNPFNDISCDFLLNKHKSCELLSYTISEQSSVLLFFFFLNFYLFIYFLNFKIFNSYMRSQTWTPLPPPSPQHPSGSSPCTSSKHAVFCIRHRLAIQFLHDSIQVSTVCPCLKSTYCNPWIWTLNRTIIPFILFTTLLVQCIYLCLYLLCICIRFGVSYELNWNNFPGILWWFL